MINHIPEIPLLAQAASRRFAARLAVFYGAVFGLVGTYLPFFPVWLKAVGIDPAWIGIITAVPSVTRFTVLPFVTSFAERRRAIRIAIVIATFATAFGFSIVGTLHQPLAVLIVFALTACFWTPLVPLTDGYALKGIAHYGLDYGPLRLWGSAAFVVGALGCGLLVDIIEAKHLIWIIASVAFVGALCSLGLQKVDTGEARTTLRKGATWLLRDRGFLAIIIASALIQGSHAAYYTVASITWQAQGLGGLTIAGLWCLGVLAEIVVFALSPRFTLSLPWYVIIGGLSACARWVITAFDPPLMILAPIQLAHGLTFGITMLGTMGLLVHHVPGDVMARAQGYLAASTGIVMSSAAVISGLIYAHIGANVYFLMAVLSVAGATIMWLGRRDAHRPHEKIDQPQRLTSGG